MEGKEKKKTRKYNWNKEIAEKKIGAHLLPKWSPTVPPMVDTLLD